ncbi:MULTISPECIES: hypothetical protein [unclassified Legionella]|uniref:hypothetical protein n=1 Tax=unclassified Legionella TaxID=2622702 RepID=UPI003AF6DCD1
MKMLSLSSFILLLFTTIAHSNQCPSYSFSNSESDATAFASPGLIPLNINIHFHGKKITAYIFGNGFSLQRLTLKFSRDEYFLDQPTEIFFEFCKGQQQIAIFKELIDKKSAIECGTSNKIICINNNTPMEPVEIAPNEPLPTEKEDNKKIIDNH